MDCISEDEKVFQGREMEMKMGMGMEEGSRRRDFRRRGRSEITCSTTTSEPAVHINLQTRNS